MLVLSLFPGIGLLDRAFEEQGFCVVRGPDLLWGGDVKTFHPPAGRFDGAIGGPPCQCFSRLRHIVEANGYALAENLIPEFERCVREAAPAWFLMENVPAAPEPQVAGYAVWSGTLNNRDFGAVQNRQRRFSFGVRGSQKVYLDRWLADWTTGTAGEWEPAVCATDGGRAVPVKIGGNGKPKGMGRAMTADRSSRTLPAACVLQGLPEDFLADAPFTYGGKRQVIGNGVPLPLGRAIARAVRLAVEAPL